jgi:hypothetical protein
MFTGYEKEWVYGEEGTGLVARAEEVGADHRHAVPSRGSEFRRVALLQNVRRHDQKARLRKLGVK